MKRSNWMYPKNLVEQSLFGVCSFLGAIMGVASNRIRMYFIYASLLTLGSPVVIYLILAFWLNIGRYIEQSGRSSFWDL